MERWDGWLEYKYSLGCQSRGDLSDNKGMVRVMVVGIDG